MIGEVDFPSLTWFKSSYSSATGQCTECARLVNGGMAVRDSTQPAGHVLLFSPGQWHAFTEEIRLTGLK